MKEITKTRSRAESYSVAETARLLGVSTPTVKRMAADGQLEGFRTPGGHLRLVAESIEALRAGRPQSRPVREASPVLQNRRERLEELTLDAQEFRARRELEKLRREEREEDERRRTEEDERKREVAQRREALELQRARLKLQERQERERREAEQRLAAFSCRWLNAATEALSANELCQLSAVERKEILDGLEVEINRRTPQDEPRMLAILRQSIAALAEPIFASRKARKRRQEAAECALWHLSAWATDSEKAQASEAARRALAALPDDATDTELRAAAERAIAPVHQAVEKRLLDARVLTWVGYQLPWYSGEQDKAGLRKRCGEILTGLPCNVSELEARAALGPTITETRQVIEEGQAREDRERRRTNLIAQGVSEVSTYLVELNRKGEISNKELWDAELTADLNRSVEAELKRKLTGDETAKEVKNLVRETVDSELF